MRNSTRSLPGLSALGKLALLAGGLLAAPLEQAQAQAPTQPSTIYVLGTATAAFPYYASADTYPAQTTYNAGDQLLGTVNPATGAQPTYPNNYPNIGTKITLASGTTGALPIVGIDIRQRDGLLYALGYNAGNATLYTLDATTAVLTPIRSFALNLSDPSRSNTTGNLPNIGFDHNPRTDQFRIVAPYGGPTGKQGGANYLLTNTGNLTTDTPLTYAASTTVPTTPATPYIGTTAYTGLRNTTEYDIDLAATNATLSTQSAVGGVLTPRAQVQFYITNSPNGAGPYQLASPTTGINLDIFANSGNVKAYLIEARLNDNSTTTYTSNLYSLSLDGSNGSPAGRANLLGNIIGKVTLFYSDLAVAVTQTKTWIGVTSTEWGTGTNWYPAGTPTSSDDVIIPGNGTQVATGNTLTTVARQPIVSDAEQAATVTLTNNALLTTANGGTLSVYGDFINNDSQVQGSGTGTVALAGSTAQDIGGTATSAFQNLTVGSAGATTSAAVSVASALTTNGTLAIGSGNSFTLLSSASGTAYVVNSLTTASITGTATVQRYISVAGGTTPPGNPGLGYRHYSAPVTNTTVNDLATSGYTPDFSGAAAYNSSTTPYYTTPFPTVFAYNQTQYNGSVAVTNAGFTDFDKGYRAAQSGESWTSGTGYTVNLGGSSLVDFMGTLADGNISTARQGRDLSRLNPGWQLLGNPYPSGLDWDLVTKTGLDGMESTVFVFRSSGQYSGSYSSYNNGVGNNGGTNQIPLAQAFFVRTSTAAATTGGRLNFQNSQRLTTAVTATFQRTASDPRPQLQLELGNGTVANQTTVYFQQGATAAYESAFDAVALPSLNGLLLTSEAGTEHLSINGQPALTSAGATVPLQIGAATAGTYTLRVSNLANLPAGTRAYLRDAQTGTVTELTATSSMSVALSNSATSGRYSVVFGTNAPLATAPAALASLVALYPNPAHNAAILVLPGTLRGQTASEVQVFNTLGQVVLRRSVAAGGSDQVALPLDNLAAGVYTVRASTTNGTVARQLVVE